MTDNTAAGPEGSGTSADRAGSARVVIGVLAALLVLAIVVIVALVVGGDDDGELGDPTTTTAEIVDPTTTTTDDGATTTAETTTTVADTTTTVAETTTTEPATTEPTPTTVAPGGIPPEEEALTVWPWIDDELRYDDPAAAAVGMLTELVEVTDPRVGEVMEGDARSAEVEVFPGTSSVPILVSVRQMSDGTWWVLGAMSPNLLLAEPMADAQVTSPIELLGESTAFEATVLVDVFLVGTPEPIHSSFFTGGGTMGELLPFEALVVLDDESLPGEPERAILVLSTPDTDDGARSDATVVRVVLGP